MKFIVNIEYTTYTKDRFYFKQELYNYFKGNNNLRDVMCTFFINAIILTTKDFDINSDKIQTCSSTCSYQYRPKAIYKNSKGYFYKLDKPIYLNKEQEREMFDFIEKCNNHKF